MASSLQAILRLPNLWGVLLALDIPSELVMDDDKALRVVTALSSIAKDWAQQPRAKTHINAVVKALGKPWTDCAQTRNGTLVEQHHCAMEALMDVLGLLGQGLQNFPEASFVLSVFCINTCVSQSLHSQLSQTQEVSLVAQDHAVFETAFGVGLAKFEILPSGGCHEVQQGLGSSHMLSLGLTAHLHSLEAALEFTLLGGTEEDPTGVAARHRDVSRLQALPLYLVVSTVRTGVSQLSSVRVLLKQCFCCKTAEYLLSKLFVLWVSNTNFCEAGHKLLLFVPACCL